MHAAEREARQDEGADGRPLLEMLESRSDAEVAALDVDRKACDLDLLFGALVEKVAQHRAHPHRGGGGAACASRSSRCSGSILKASALRKSVSTSGQSARCKTPCRACGGKARCGRADRGKPCAMW